MHCSRSTHNKRKGNPRAILVQASWSSFGGALFKAHPPTTYYIQISGLSDFYRSTSAWDCNGIVAPLTCIRILLKHFARVVSSHLCLGPRSHFVRVVSHYHICAWACVFACCGCGLALSYLCLGPRIGAGGFAVWLLSPPNEAAALRGLVEKEAHTHVAYTHVCIYRYVLTIAGAFRRLLISPNG